MTKFTDLNLDKKVLKAIEDAGYTEPTPIQAAAIPPALEGKDVLGIAQTGTGKTASFTLPMITRLARGRARARMPRSLVLCPTRELAAQVAENFDTYAKYHKLTKALLIGGVSFKEQDKLIDKGVDVLICTPGRLLDHFERGKLILTDVKIMVVDEADRMLDMGFIPDIERIFGLTPFTRQTLFFSATMAPEIERITNTFLSAPAKVEMARQASASERIEQHAVMFKPSRKDRSASEKRTLLRTLLKAEGDTLQNGIVFCNRKTDVDIVAKSLKKYGYGTAPIHGDLDQSQRNATLESFREGKIQILVASDVAARGLDVATVTHVFNFDVPGHPEDYVHRIGRTGRAGREGKAIILVEPRDEKNFEDVERLLEKEIPRMENPISKTAKPSQPAPVKTNVAPAVDAAPETAITEAPVAANAETPTEKPKRKRTRSRRKPASEATQVAVVTDVTETPVVEAVAEAAPAPAATPVPAEVAPKPAAVEEAPVQAPQSRGRARNERNTDTRPEPRSNDNRNSRGRGRGREEQNRVVGLGDHLPSFIALSFDERFDA
jgi:superfamily II DNA/RNA helicase